MTEGMTAVVISDKFLMLDSFVPIAIYRLLKPMKSMHRISSESNSVSVQKRKAALQSTKRADRDKHYIWRCMVDNSSHIRGTVERII